MIIGPPGAGKTTAIKHSGLVFPFQGQGGGAVRGVGGTRNVDWWFTNEAILLDTAGRWTSEQEDREEWLAFLAMLKRYRSRRPINGVLVAVNIAELIDGNEQTLETLGKKLRARVDEVMTQLQMVVPVYVLFTKCDLIAGFNEFFGEMKKSDRAQAWGATLKLDLDKSNPSKLFDDEFELLRKQIHARSLKRLATERNREAREKIYQFPLEFAGVKRNLSEMLASAFAVNAFQGTPILRGFYFTSGTQEGRPLDRVLGRMGQAMGLRPPETAVQQVTESKSYFLHDVFMNVVFPDGSIAARTAGELRRQRLMRVAISGSALSLAIISAGPGVNSFLNNREFLKTTLDRVKAADAVDWEVRDKVAPKLDALDPLLERLKQIDRYKKSGIPVSMKWGMYQGDVVEGAAVAEYVKVMQNAMVKPVQKLLEDKIKLFKGEKYLQERTLLKTYLMLSDPEHLDVDPNQDLDADDVAKTDGNALAPVTQAWMDVLKKYAEVTDTVLMPRLRPHVRYYLKLIKTQRVAPVPSDDKLVAGARKTLQSVPVAKRYYELFVNSLIDELYVPGADPIASNKKYPPLRLQDVFSEKPDILRFVTSKLYLKEKRYKEIEGPYTDKGHYRVIRNVQEGATYLEREKWVVPLGPEEQLERVPVNLEHLAQEYDQRYAETWTDWLLDIDVKQPVTVQDAIDLYQMLTAPPRPYVSVLRALEDGTQWKDTKKEAWENDEVQRVMKQEANLATTRALRGIRLNIDLKKIGPRTSTVPGIFRKTVDFAVPGTGNGNDPPVNKYLSQLEALRLILQKAEDAQKGSDPRLVSAKLDDALRDTMDLLQGSDDRARVVLTPLLTIPLKFAGTKLPPAGTQQKQVIPPGGGTRWRRY
jgi:type VI secretion system protein ImpL